MKMLVSLFGTLAAVVLMVGVLHAITVWIFGPP